MTNLWCTCLVLIITTELPRLAFAAENFAIDGRNYDCNANLICLGDAHIRSVESSQSSEFYGTLSLTHVDRVESNGASAGIAYYNKPIRMMDPSTQQTASFNTSFVFYQITSQNHTGNETTLIPGDGLTFVISANNSTLGASGSSLGFFNTDLNTDFKSIVVEFDSFWNKGPPVNDIGWSHMSFDFMNITAAVARNTSDVDLYFWNPPVYAWVEYRAGTRQLEARISSFQDRPSTPFLNFTVNLTNFLEEYMWVGFSGANGLFHSVYYLGDWTFQTLGIPSVVPPAEKLPQSKMSIETAIGYTAGVAIFIDLFLLISLCFFFSRRRRTSGSSRFIGPMSWRVGSDSRKSSRSDIMLQLALRAEGYCFSYEELKVATQDFSEEGKLGQGGFGSVYRGVASEFPIAVKKVNRESKEGEKEFMAEVAIISQLRHRNLLQLLGWCIETGKYYIVYDLMPNGSLDKLLFKLEDDEQDVLSWPQRLHIVHGTAAAVEYLHQGWKQQVIHRDIKPSNIMLDENWNARLGDFGLARLADHQRPPSTTINLAGTYGYMAPEIIASRRFTEKTDVFSFGAVALEIACGRRSIEVNVEPEEIILVDWVWQRLTEGDLLSVVDKRLGAYDKDEMEALLLVGLLCSHPDPTARPSMRNVMQILLGEVPAPSVPTPKPVPTYNHLIMKANPPQNLSPESIPLTGSFA